MKKLLTLFAFCLLFCTAPKAQYVTLPDSTFAYALKRQFPSCFNAANQLDTTCSAIINLDSLYIRNDNIYTWPVSPFITNFSGLKYFKNLHKLKIENFAPGTALFPDIPPVLEYFYCQYFNAVTWPTLPNSLQYIDCRNNYSLTGFPNLPTNLKYLDCNYSTNLMAFPVFPRGLKYINADKCSRIAYLPTLPVALETLICSNCQIANLPALPASLTYLDCRNNSPLTGLPSLPPSLKVLYCQMERPNPRGIMTGLPALPNSLTEFDCSRNRINAFPSLPASLKTLNCSYNAIPSLPALPASLETLNCDSNNIHSLPVLINGLVLLSCGGNPLYNLPAIPRSLTILNCWGDSLSGVLVLPPNIYSLGCSKNQITQIIADSLAGIDCSNNPISEVPSSKRDILGLNIRGTNIHCIPYIRSDPFQPFPLGSTKVYHFYVDSGQLACVPNYPNNLNTLTYFDILFPGPTYYEQAGHTASYFPICDKTNNTNNCQAYPQVSGIVFYDVNNNGIKDTNEPPKQYAKVSLSPTQFAYTNQNGFYQISTDTIGAYSLRSTASTYYEATPLVYNLNFTSYDTSVTANFALRPTRFFDSLSVRAIPWGRGRPGFPLTYFLGRSNAGTNTISPSAIFKYDTTRLVFDSSSNPLAVHTPGTLSLPPATLLPFENNYANAYFRLKTTAVIGDSLIATITGNAGGVDYTDRSSVLIGGSFDPNDKQATTRLTPAEMQAGKYIDYTVRFQNTGTDTAFTVVIKDELSSYLQYNSLEVSAASHPCKTTLKGNTIYFEFLNILLPDSNVNEPKSHGFVSFRVKPKALTTPTNILNYADIYFDYNSPVRTNTAKTVVNDLIVLPLRLVSFSAVPQNDNTTTLFWKTANEINTKQFVIEQSSDGMKFNSISNVLAKGRASNNYSANVADINNSLVYYRLKIIDNDGSISYSPILKIDRRKNTTGIAVLTNPVKDFIIINTNDRSLSNTQCTILSTQGAVVKNFMVKQGSQTVEVKGLPPGIYYLQSVNGSQKILIR